MILGAKAPTAYRRYEVRFGSDAPAERGRAGPKCVSNRLNADEISENCQLENGGPH
jgi:hypothetical protein